MATAELRDPQPRMSRAKALQEVTKSIKDAVGTVHFLTSGANFVAKTTSYVGDKLEDPDTSKLGNSMQKRTKPLADTTKQIEALAKLVNGLTTMAVYLEEGETAPGKWGKLAALDLIMPLVTLEDNLRKLIRAGLSPMEALNAVIDAAKNLLYEAKMSEGMYAPMTTQPKRGRKKSAKGRGKKSGKGKKAGKAGKPRRKSTTAPRRSKRLAAKRKSGKIKPGMYAGMGAFDVVGQAADGALEVASQASGGMTDKALKTAVGMGAGAADFAAPGVGGAMVNSLAHRATGGHAGRSTMVGDMLLSRVPGA